MSQVLSHLSSEVQFILYLYNYCWSPLLLYILQQTWLVFLFYNLCVCFPSIILELSPESSRILSGLNLLIEIPDRNLNKQFLKAQVSYAGLISKRMDCISIQNPKHHYQNPRRRWNKHNNKYSKWNVTQKGKEGLHCDKIKLWFQQ